MPCPGTLDSIYRKNLYIDYLMLFNPFSLSFPFTILSLPRDLAVAVLPALARAAMGELGGPAMK
jgi:hypothetical protein